MLEQALTSIFEKLDDELETTVATIVRIRNYGVARMMSGKICHHVNFLAIITPVATGTSISHPLISNLDAIAWRNISICSVAIA